MKFSQFGFELDRGFVAEGGVEPASGRAAIRAIAIVRLQARNRLYRGPGAHSSEPSRQLASSLGSFAGVSKRTVEKIAAVVKAADVDREKFGHLVEEMDRTGSRAAGRRGQTFRSERLKLPDIGNVWGLAFAAAAPAGSTARARGFFRAAFAPARTFAVGPGAAAARTTPTAGRDLRPPPATPVSLPWRGLGTKARRLMDGVRPRRTSR